MKLLVSWMNELRTYVSREFYYIMQDLIREHGWRQIEPDGLPDDPALAMGRLVEAAGGLPEAILFWETYALSVRLHPALCDTGCSSFVFADDLHLLWGCESMREEKLRAFALCDAVLCPYAYRFAEVYPELCGRKTVVWIPHSASPDFALPFNEEPENTILLSGAGGPHYPLRGRMKDLQEAGHEAIAHRDHPGYTEVYDYENDPRVGVAYARTIHRHRAAFTDASVFRYVVAKYFEIPATGSLLFADAAVAGQMAELGFIEGVHYVTTTADELEEKIRYVIDGRSAREIDDIRRRGQELVLSRHRTRDRAALIDQVCVSNR